MRPRRHASALSRRRSARRSWRARSETGRPARDQILAATDRPGRGSLAAHGVVAGLQGAAISQRSSSRRAPGARTPPRSGALADAAACLEGRRGVAGRPGELCGDRPGGGEGVRARQVAGVRVGVGHFAEDRQHRRLRGAGGPGLARHRRDARIQGPHLGPGRFGLGGEALEVPLSSGRATSSSYSFPDRQPRAAVDVHVFVRRRDSSAVVSVPAPTTACSASASWAPSRSRSARLAVPATTAVARPPDGRAHLG